MKLCMLLKSLFSLQLALSAEIYIGSCALANDLYLIKILKSLKNIGLGSSHNF